MTGRDLGNGALVGIDLGTSSAKAVACRADGTPLVWAARAYALRTPRPGFAELLPAEVLAGADAALRDVLRAMRAAKIEVAALGLSCAMHGIVPVDARGEPLGPCLTWLDRRSAGVAAQWLRDGDAARLYARTGAPVHPMLPSCKLRWLIDNEPELVQRAAKFVSLKELLVFQWCGRWVVDWGIASATGLFDLRTRCWDERALGLARVDAARLSRLAAPSTRLRLSEAAARELELAPGLPVVLGSSDGACANFGTTPRRSDDFALTLGTSGALRLIVDEPLLDVRGRTFCYAADDRRYLVGGATSSAGAVIEKFADWLLPDIAQADRFTRALALASEAPRGARGLTLAPFLSGERAPYWRVDLHGALTGLDLAHERADILRAAFESVVFAVRSVYDVLLERLPRPRCLRLSGALTRQPFIRQLIADVFGCATSFRDHTDASAYGAALLAGRALGAADDGAVDDSGPVGVVNVPNQADAERYAAVYERYQRVVAATLDL